MFAKGGQLWSSTGVGLGHLCNVTWHTILSCKWSSQMALAQFILLISIFNVCHIEDGWESVHRGWFIKDDSGMIHRLGLKTAPLLISYKLLMCREPTDLSVRVSEVHIAIERHMCYLSLVVDICWSFKEHCKMLVPQNQIVAGALHAMQCTGYFQIWGPSQMSPSHLYGCRAIYCPSRSTYLVKSKRMTVMRSVRGAMDSSATGCSSRPALFAKNLY